MTSYSKRFFKFYQTNDGPCQLATPAYDMAEWNFLVTICKHVENWPVDATVILKDDGGDIEDLPWFVGEGTFASRRFCDLVHEIVDGQMQLLPVSIELDGLDASRAHEKYSVVNWLREVDCLHREKAGFHKNLRHGFLQASQYILDESLIPDDAIVFRVKYKMSAIVVREDFLETLVQNGITGWKTTGIEVG